MLLAALATVAVSSAGRRAPLPAVPSGNLIANPSAELSAGGTAPDGWSTSSASGKKVTFQYTSLARTGTHGLGVLVSKGTADQGWMPAAVAAQPKAVYTFSDWYESNVPTHLVVLATRANGRTSTVADQDVPPAATWTQAQLVFTTPGSTTGVTAYHALSMPGQLTTDDYDLRGTTGPTPTVSLAAPPTDTPWSGVQQLSATADGAGSPIASVQLLVDGDEAGNAGSTPPYAFSWDTRTVSSGTHVLTAVVTNKRGVTGSSDPLTVTVANTCTLADTASCESAGGTFITFHDVTAQQGNSGFVFQCTGPLVSYQDPRATITGSGWPVHLTLDYKPGSYNYARGVPKSAGTTADLSGVSLANGCTGDGDPSTIDLIVHIAGDGRTYGLEKDALKLTGSSGPSNIQITTGTGAINCGPREGNDTSAVNHQDGIQVQSGRGIGFYGVTIGDWAGQRATCSGGGGAFFLSSSNSHAGRDIHVEGMRAIACNHGLGGDAGGNTTSGQIESSVFRTGRPSDRTDTLVTIDAATGTNTVGLCAYGSSPLSPQTLALAGWSYDDVTGDAWSASGDPWSPGFDPEYG